MSIEACTISIYLLFAIFITVHLGKILYNKGAVLLYYVFYEQKEWVIPINNIMLCGFYLVNIGMAALYYQQNISLDTIFEAIAFLSTKMGGLLVIIGSMHLINVLFFLLIKWGYLTSNKIKL